MVDLIRIYIDILFEAIFMSPKGKKSCFRQQKNQLDGDLRDKSVDESVALPFRRVHLRIFLKSELFSLTVSIKTIPNLLLRSADPESAPKARSP